MDQEVLDFIASIDKQFGNQKKNKAIEASEKRFSSPSKYHNKMNTARPRFEDIETVLSDDKSLCGSEAEPVFGSDIEESSLMADLDAIVDSDLSGYDDDNTGVEALSLGRYSRDSRHVSAREGAGSSRYSGRRSYMTPTKKEEDDEDKKKKASLQKPYNTAKTISRSAFTPTPGVDPQKLEELRDRDRRRELEKKAMENKLLKKSIDRMSREDKYRLGCEVARGLKDTKYSSWCPIDETEENNRKTHSVRGFKREAQLNDAIQKLKDETQTHRKELTFLKHALAQPFDKSQNNLGRKSA